MGGFERLGGSWALIGRVPILDRFEAMLSDPGLMTNATPVGMALVGPAGVGKSRLAAECQARAAKRGWGTARMVGSQAASSIPFSAALHLLAAADPEDEDVATTIRRAHQQITEPGPLCIVVDDIDLLDDASATLVQQVAASVGVAVIVTARSDRAAVGLLTALWRDGAVARVDIDALNRAEHDALAAAVLGAEMDDASAKWLFQVSGGNPLFIRELLMSAAEDNSLVQNEEGQWHFARPPRASSRLAEVVASRIGSLDDTERQCLESIAVAEPIGLDVLETLGLGVAVSRLERRRLIHAVSAGGHVDLVTAYPLYAEVVRDRLRPLRARNVRRGLAEALEARPVRRQGDALRIATWKLEAGVADTPTNLIAAAHDALVAGSVDNALRFARAAHETDPSAATSLVLARSYFRARNGVATETVLAKPSAATDGPLGRVDLAVLRAKNMFWLLGRDDDALKILDDAVETVDADARRVAEDAIAELRACGEHLGGAADPLDNGQLHLRVLRLIAAGRFADALSCLRSSRGNDEVAVMALEAFVLVEGGWLASGRSLGERAVQRSQGARIAGEGWAHFAIGTALIADGDGAGALESFRHAGNLFDRHSDPLPLSLCTSRAVFSLMLLGDMNEARLFLGRVPAHARHRIFADQLDRADAAMAIAEDNQAAGAAVLRRRIEIARSHGQSGIEQVCLHDLVRLEVADDHERDRAVALGVQLATPLAALRGRHATCGTDGTKLAELANDAEREGFAVWACELASAARTRLAASGNARASAAEQRRIVRLRAEFPRAMLMTPTGAVPEPGIELRPGEREVAVLAAEGLSDREIAERLVLSIRTVGNYLQRVYRRLGISGRDELATALVDAERRAS